MLRESRKRIAEARRRWTGGFDYVFQPQSSLLGAAMLGQMYLAGKHGQRFAGVVS